MRRHFVGRRGVFNNGTSETHTFTHIVEKSCRQARGFRQSDLRNTRACRQIVAAMCVTPARFGSLFVAPSGPRRTQNLPFSGSPQTTITAARKALWHPFGITKNIKMYVFGARQNILTGHARPDETHKKHQRLHFLGPKNANHDGTRGPLTPLRDHVKHEFINFSS